MFRELLTRLSDNIQLLYYYSFTHGLIFVSPLFILYLQSHLDSTSQVTTLLSLQNLTIFALEIPSGLIADLYGRKFTLLTCSLFRLLGSAVLIYTHLFMLNSPYLYYYFLIIVMLEGCSQSMFSGTDIALLYDTLSERNEIHRFKSCLSMKSLMSPLAACLASIIGGYVAEQYSFLVPAVLSALATIMGIVFVLRMTEIHITPEQLKVGIEVEETVSMKNNEHCTKFDKIITGDKSSKEQVKTLRRKHVRAPSIHPETQAGDSFWAHIAVSYKIIAANTQLQYILVCGLLLYSFTESTHRLRTVFYQSKSIPTEFHGLLSGFGFGLSAFGSFLSPSISTRYGSKATLIFCAVIPSLLQLLSSFALNNSLIYFCLLCNSFLFGIRGPILSVLLHSHLNQSCRATIFSLQSLANKFCLSLSLPFVAGPLIDYAGIQFTYKVFGVLAMIPGFWIWWKLEEEKDELHTAKPKNE